MSLAKDFMYKHRMIIISAKILKLLIVLFLVSCESKPEPSKKPDTVRVDSINGNSPEDSTKFKNDDDEDDDDKDDDNQNPMVPQES